MSGSNSQLPTSSSFQECDCLHQQLFYKPHFYSLSQSASANYGGIGAVIAHEISHAFDNNGAKFDEFGNLNNWWTAEDLAHFETLAQEMINEFDGFAICWWNGQWHLGQYRKILPMMRWIKLCTRSSRKRN